MKRNLLRYLFTLVVLLSGLSSSAYTSFTGYEIDQPQSTLRLGADSFEKNPTEYGTYISAPISDSRKQNSIPKVSVPEFEEKEEDVFSGKKNTNSHHLAIFKEFLVHDNLSQCLVTWASYHIPTCFGFGQKRYVLLQVFRL